MSFLRNFEASSTTNSIETKSSPLAKINIENLSLALVRHVFISLFLFCVHLDRWAIYLTLMFGLEFILLLILTRSFVCSFVLVLSFYVPSELLLSVVCFSTTYTKSKLKLFLHLKLIAFQNPKIIIKKQPKQQDKQQKCSNGLHSNDGSR